MKKKKSNAFTESFISISPIIKKGIENQSKDVIPIYYTIFQFLLIFSVKICSNKKIILIFHTIKYYSK